MKLRGYQEEVLRELTEAFSNKIKEVCVAASPSSGKTLMALSYVKQNPDKKFLILTHGQNVLLKQWRKDIKGMFGTETPSNVIYGLPQSLSKKELESVDYLIIDEAHEFTFATMVQAIKKQIKAKRTIYLTGTPSKFVANGTKVICVDATRLIQEGHVSDLYLGLFSTNADIKGSDYNADMDVTETAGAKKLEKSVTADLGNLLKALNKRLKETNFIKSSPNANKLMGWVPTFNKLEKTMIACRSIKQAASIQKFFENEGVNIITSNSDNDPHTENIEKFMEENYQLLVVVDRGILGFNMPNLVNVIDMTCSHNIDRIYQLYARVMRQNDKYPKKYFFKLTNTNDMILTRFYMNAALNLMRKEFITKYNGKNLNGMRIPVIISKKKRDEKLEGASLKQVSNLKEKKHYIDPDFYADVSANQMLTDVWNKIDDNLNEYAYVTFSGIKEQVLGQGRQIVNITEENLLYMIRTGEVDERIYE